MIKLISGLNIKIKLVLLTSVIMLLIFIATSLSIQLIVQPYLTQLTLTNIENLQAQRMEIFINFRERLEISSNTILANGSVQNSLVEVIDSYEAQHIEKTLVNLTSKTVKNILYVDNKNNYYGSFISSDNELIASIFKDERFTEYYAIPTWTITNEPLLELTNEDYIYIAQYVRHIELRSEPGNLLIQVDTSELDKIVSLIAHQDERILIVDHNNNIAYPSNATAIDESIVNSNSDKLSGYIVNIATDKRTDWKVISYINNLDVQNTILDLQAIIFVLNFIMLIIGIILVFVIMSHYTKPIQQIVKVMESFGSNSMKMRIKPPSGELGKIGITFNNMADNIEQHIENEKENQERLKIAELDSLTYQINPHFIYNILDNMYMLSRGSGDRRIGMLIESLSKLLRTSLSKGSSLVSIYNEIEHLQSYLEVQQIRYENLFEFKITCNNIDKDISILKLILQPIAENSITHGFGNIESGGLITVEVYSDDTNLFVTITDNGVGIDPAIAQKYNETSGLTAEKISQLFPNTTGGYGIGNVIARLNLYYKGNYSFKYTNIGNGTKCTICLPKKFTF